ncbi:MAG TPA: metallophosphoesterase family protein [Verrucomicrobia bacterium]|nr:metallophosphoesterase family protein [Verrucomicrobiota bacterium]HOP99062.1 metallophosphoesterase family protein [Verrucomicrobiota bacterium]HPU57109.1 metallophosphoesterase family protein [Verrucomicrobiota bacterium]
MKIGVLSDTHGYLDPKIETVFKGVDHILHAGDVGSAWITAELAQIAPVTAVLGNVDKTLHLRDTELVEVGGRRFLVHHIVDPRDLSDYLRERIAQDRPDAVVFGHTHQRFCQMFGGVLFFNPGYAGKQRFDLDRSVAILRWDEHGIRPQYIEL